MAYNIETPHTTILFDDYIAVITPDCVYLRVYTYSNPYVSVYDFRYGQQYYFK